jgi:hypothetical protein
MMGRVFTWNVEQFPILYEGNQPKAVLVDIDTFRQLDFVLDNLMNREPEPEDALLSESSELRRLVASIKRTAHASPNWEQELNEL